VARARPDAFTPDLALSLDNLSGCLSALGRREAALEAIEEAVALYRELACARPDAFTPDLARSLGVRGRALALADHVGRAMASVAEGARMLIAWAGFIPAAHRSLAEALARDYLSYCERDGVPADAGLIERLADRCGVAAEDAPAGGGEGGEGDS
jgi:hypothetical protein